MSEEKTVLGGGDAKEAPQPKKSNSSSRNRKRSKQTKNEVTAPEMQKGFYYLFAIMKKVLHSDAVFEEKEFKNAGQAYVDLANRFPALKYASLLMAPLATFGELLELSQRLWKTRQPRQKKQKAQAPGTMVSDYTEHPGLDDQQQTVHAQ